MICNVEHHGDMMEEDLSHKKIVLDIVHTICPWNQINADVQTSDTFNMFKR